MRIDPVQHGHLAPVDAVRAQALQPPGDRGCLGCLVRRRLEHGRGSRRTLGTQRHVPLARACQDSVRDLDDLWRRPVVADELDLRAPGWRDAKLSRYSARAPANVWIVWAGSPTTHTS